MHNCLTKDDLTNLKSPPHDRHQPYEFYLYTRFQIFIAKNVYCHAINTKSLHDFHINEKNDANHKAQSKAITLE